MTSLHTVARRPFAVPGGGTPAHVHTQADLRSHEARRALQGMDVLYHLGFQLWRGKGGPSAMGNANVSGTVNVLGAAPARVVLASSAAVYGAWPDNPLPLHEDHPPRPNPECSYATDKLAAEERCLEAASTVVLRIAAVLGPGADRRVARSVQGYRFAVPAVRGARQALQFVDEADVVAALMAAGSSAATGICNVATTDWLDAPAIASLSGGRVVTVPRGVLLCASEIGRRCRLLPFGADRAVLVGGPLALSVERAGHVLGWRPRRTSAGVLDMQLGPASSMGQSGLAS